MQEWLKKREADVAEQALVAHIFAYLLAVVILISNLPREYGVNTFAALLVSTLIPATVLILIDYNFLQKDYGQNVIFAWNVTKYVALFIVITLAFTIYPGESLWVKSVLYLLPTVLSCITLGQKWGLVFAGLAVVSIYLFSLALDFTGNRIAEVILVLGGIFFLVTWLLGGTLRVEKETTERFAKLADEHKQAEKKIQEANKNLDQIIEFLPDATFVINQNGIVVAWNKAMEEMTGIPKNNILGKGNYEYSIPFLKERKPSLIDLLLIPESEFNKHKQEYEAIDWKGNVLFSETYVPGIYKGQGAYLWSRASKLYDSEGNVTGAIETLRDVTQRKKVEKDLIYQKEAFEALFKNSTEAIVAFDENHRVIDINQNFCDLFGYNLEEIKGKDVDDVVDIAKERSLSRHYTSTVVQGENVFAEGIRYTKESKPLEVSIKGVPILIDGKFSGGYGIYTDISEQKRYERELKYLSLHDQLTGLYNRAYFENELDRLDKSRDYPITVISADLDNLKIINDALGHDTGDEFLKVCAQVLKESLRDSDILARIGGDEFVALLPRTTRETGDKIVNRIFSQVDLYNREHKGPFFLGVSVGLSTAEDESKSLEGTFKEADNLMYRNKLQRGVSGGRQMINSLIAMLGERDFDTEGHARRLEELSRKMGESLNLSKKQLSNLSLLAQMHDLGKVGVPDKVLFKEETLNEEERRIMQQHSEIGHRIARTSTDLSEIAELILKHHENWDGSGYPLRIKKEEIPVECRILAIVDAYDAMTSDRPYRKSMSQEKAVEELKRSAGTQFDPNLVEIFLSILEDNMVND